MTGKGMWLAAGAVLLVVTSVAIALVGCGGGGAAAAPPAMVTVSGWVCDATDTSAPIGGAHIVASRPMTLSAGARLWGVVESYTGPDGSYRLRGAFTDMVAILVEPTDGFSGNAVVIDISGQATVEMEIQITLLPSSLIVGELEVQPAGPLMLDPLQQQQFTATVYGGSGGVIPNVTPTWYVSGGIGAVDESGLFAAGSSHATGHVVAVVSYQAGLVDVTVGVEGTTHDLMDDFPIQVGDKWPA